MVSDADVARWKKPASPILLGGGIWEYWRDIAMPTGRGIEAQVEEVSSELETKNLFKATLIGPGKVFSRLGR